MKKSSVSKKKKSSSSPFNNITKKDNNKENYTKKFKPKKLLPNNSDVFGLKSYSMNNTMINTSMPNSRSTSSRSKQQPKRSPVENYFTLAKNKKFNKDIKCVATESFPNKFMDCTDTESENYISYENQTPNSKTKCMFSSSKKRYEFQEKASSKKKSRNHKIKKVDTICTLPEKGISFSGMPSLNKT